MKNQGRAGVFSVRLNNPDRRRVLQTCASLLAISIERIHYIDVAQRTTMQMESERLRNSLLSAISHDLRTPLTALVGLADTLEITTPPPSTQQREIATAIRQSALRMNALVNNLLDMARLESGTVQLNCQWQPIEEVIGSALSACKQLLNGRPITTRLPDNLPLLHIDAVLIERVLVNLLENTAKYTPAGTAIEIEGYIKNNQVLITISDHGPGLPKGKEKLIFDKFERGKKESATPGVGLGLAICKAIMQVHKGHIDGKNRPSGGAIFTLTLPCGTPPIEHGALNKELSE
jgi:two-component system sensor histidine kinase KdpD